MDDAFLLENGSAIDGAGSAPFAAAVLVEGDSIAALGEDALARAQHLHSATGAGAFALKMAGRTGVVAAGMKGDILVLDGDPSPDVRFLGEPGRIKQVFVDGKAADLSPLRERKPISGWRMPSMEQQLTRAFALGQTTDGQAGAGATGERIEEL